MTEAIAAAGEVRGGLMYAIYRTITQLTVSYSYESLMCSVICPGLYNYIFTVEMRAGFLHENNSQILK